MNFSPYASAFCTREAPAEWNARWGGRRRGLKVPIVLTCILWWAGGARVLAATTEPNGNQAPTRPYIVVSAPYRINLGQPFQFEVYLVPAAKTPVTISFEANGIEYSPTQLTLAPGEKKVSTATAITTRDGIAWIHAYADDHAYGERFLGINAGFLGHLEPTAPIRLAYNVPATLTLSLVDRDHQPFAAGSPLTLHLESADAVLTAGMQQGSLRLQLPADATVTPQFSILSRRRQGGTVHLTCYLAMGDHPAALDSETFSIAADPAVWLPILMAIGGGLVYGLWRILEFRPPNGQRPWMWRLTVLSASALAGYIGYLIADFDLLGLKLDPTVLRTYPLLGFLVAYIGIDNLRGLLPVKAARE